MVPTFRDFMRITDMFYWPLVDITLFGFMAVWAQENNPKFMLAITTCVASWYLVQRTALEIARNILMEMWDNHLVNLLATPLSLMELMIALMFLGAVQALITFVYSLSIIWIFYSQNIFLLIGSLLPFIVLLIISGWIIGFIIVSLLLFFGKTVDTLPWAVLWLFAIISGAFYPVKLFPKLLQNIAYSFPTTYLFEGMREMIIYHQAPYYYLATGFVLICIYFVISSLILKWSFEKSKQKGLARLE